MARFVHAYEKPCNFKEDILTAARGEPIEAIVIGDYGWDDEDDCDTIRLVSSKGQLMSWSEAEPHLDYEYDRGFGSPECHAITAWTASRVIFVVQYDGSTRVLGVPRNPVAHMPIMPGG